MTALATSNTLEELLRSGIGSLDITPQERTLAISRYGQVANALRRHWSEDPYDGAVYPQGSMRLGTVTRKYHRNDEIDIDLVARRDRSKDTISQADLKSDTGAALAAFVQGEPEGAPQLDEEGKRCWTLTYDAFHLDVLPALPDLTSQTESGIIITDREALRWQYSDPIAYAAWFHEVMREEYEQRRSVVAKQTDIAAVPAWAVKTTLQQSVQALKRHRDIYFTDHLDLRPASVIITTLAARAYRGGVDLVEVLDDVTDRMPTFVENRLGRYVVANPVQHKENFADRWNSDPQRAKWFFRWAEQARADFDELAGHSGIDTVITKMAAALGGRVATAASRGLGRGVVATRHRSGLGYQRGTGTLMVAGLGTAGVRRIASDHTFHGDSGARR